jgi:cell wall-associated NlpC family hydrolase
VPALLVLALLTGGPVGSAGAVPPPPPNPSDSDISASRADADAKAARVGELTSQLTDADAKLQQLSDDVELKLESANKARVDLQNAQDAATKAQQAATAAKSEADAAGSAIDSARKQLDEFAAASFQQGSTIGSVSAYLGATSPEDLLARAQLLNAVGTSQLTALDQLQRARTDKANKDSAARAAADVAQQKQAAADQAKRDADAAQAAAEQARAGQAAQTASLQHDRDQVQAQLTDAQSKVDGLAAQRQQYDDWLVAKQQEDADNARRAAEAAAQQHPAPAPGGSDSGGDNSPPPAPSGGGVQTVINRAMSQLGVRYSWGGGNYDGPTIGIRDGGVADEYGDYQNVGFDCSGLMMYAFAGVGVYLPHYSGYQYTAGEHVPLSDIAPGDMLFWGPGGGQHVALYIGNGMMIEAPYSGSQVRIAPVRYGGIMPYATRVL